MPSHLLVGEEEDQFLDGGTYKLTYMDVNGQEAFLGQPMIDMEFASSIR